MDSFEKKTALGMLVAFILVSIIFFIGNRYDMQDCVAKKGQWFSGKGCLYPPGVKPYE